MNSGSGIQELMAAETRASQIVAEARIGELVLPSKETVLFRHCPLDREIHEQRCRNLITSLTLY